MHCILCIVPCVWYIMYDALCLVHCDGTFPVVTLSSLHYLIKIKGKQQEELRHSTIYVNGMVIERENILPKGEKHRTA